MKILWTFEDNSVDEMDSDNLGGFGNDDDLVAVPTTETFSQFVNLVELVGRTFGKLQLLFPPTSCSIYSIGNSVT